MQSVPPAKRDRVTLQAWPAKPGLQLTLLRDLITCDSFSFSLSLSRSFSFSVSFSFSFNAQLATHFLDPSTYCIFDRNLGGEVSSDRVLGVSGHAASKSCEFQVP